MAGRPIEYTIRHLELAKEYLESCRDTYNDQNKLKVKLPSIEGLARHLQRNELHVYRQTLYDWRERFPEFNDILEAILSEQAERLINSSISGEYNSNIAKLLMGKHGYTDKSEVDQKTDGTIKFICE